jgi:hypothetical protein
MFGAVAVLVTGCVEHRVVYVPVYQARPVAGQSYALAAPPGTNLPPSSPALAGAPANTVVVAQAPPPVPVEVVPLTPGPDYYWAPGYWSWNGAWLWVRGSWVLRPRPGAIWVGGHWGPHPRGFVWVGGHWR